MGAFGLVSRPRPNFASLLHRGNLPQSRGEDVDPPYGDAVGHAVASSFRAVGTQLREIEVTACRQSQPRSKIRARTWRVVTIATSRQRTGSAMKRTWRRSSKPWSWTSVLQVPRARQPDF